MRDTSIRNAVAGVLGTAGENGPPETTTEILSAYIEALSKGAWFHALRS